MVVHPDLTGRRWGRFRENSWRRLGRPSRLRPLLWIHRARDSRFHRSEPPAEVVAQSAAGAELRRLVTLCMLSEHSEPGQRRIYYQREPSPLWAIVSAAEQALATG